ncbi:MAG: oxidoreductase [Paucimonas sp.]|nr:oxidoreductase [Paucimonas sp.]
MQSTRIRLTANGPEFSRIVLGMWRLHSWQLNPSERLAMLEQALELGITTIDHADIYGSYAGEALFGEALALKPSLRDRIEIVTKCGIKGMSPNRPHHGINHYETSREHIIQSAENSLRDLRTDHLDLLLIHRPDALMEADEVASAFESLQKSGKVRHFGVSNFMPWQFELLSSRFPLVTNQIELSVMHLEPLHDGQLDQCQRLRFAPMIWSALAGGHLFTEENDRTRRVRAALSLLADKYGVSPTTIAYAWVLRHPSKPIVLTGSRRISAAGEAVAATAITLTHEEWYTLWSASTGTSVP